MAVTETFTTPYQDCGATGLVISLHDDGNITYVHPTTGATITLTSTLNNICALFAAAREGTPLPQEEQPGALFTGDDEYLFVPCSHRHDFKITLDDSETELIYTNYAGATITLPFTLADLHGLYISAREGSPLPTVAL